MILAYSLFSKSDFKKIFKDLKCEEPCHTVLVTGLVQALGKSTYIVCRKPSASRADKRSNVLTKYLLISAWSQKGRFWDGRN